MTTTATPSKSADEPLWATTEVARFLGCSERQIHVLRKQGLPAVRVGNLIRFIPEHVHAWLSGCDASVTADRPDDGRLRQLADVAAHNDGDAAECAAADLAREFPGSAP